MKEVEARERLAQLLAECSPGYLLHVISDLLVEAADREGTEDRLRSDGLRLVGHAVQVLAHGVDVLLPG